MTKKFTVPIDVPGATVTGDIEVTTGDLLVPVIYTDFVVSNSGTPLTIGNNAAVTVDLGGSSLDVVGGVVTADTINPGPSGILVVGGHADWIVDLLGAQIDKAGSIKCHFYLPRDGFTTMVVGGDSGTTVDLAGSPMVNLATPTVASNPATKGYVDGMASGAGLFFGFDFDTTTTAGAASTRLRLNNATPASATAVYVSYTSKDAVDLKARLLAGTAGDRLFIQDRNNSANYRVYELTGTPTDGTTYATCAVVHRGGGGSLWANDEGVVAGFTAPPITVGTTAPSSPMTNDIWIDTT